MKKISLLILLFFSASYSQEKSGSCDVILKINALLQREHFQPKPVDDSLSVFVFEALLADLDTDKNIFLKSEYEYLSKYKYNIDDHLNNKDCSFFKDFSNTFEKALKRTKSVIEKIQASKLDYTKIDTVRFTKKVFPFYVTSDDVERVYTKRLKFDILEDISKSSKNLDSLKLNFISLEKKSKQKIIETALCKIESRLNVKTDLEETIKESFYNAFCTYFDPHTSYFSYDTKSSFLSGLSTSSLSIGMYVNLNENDELIVQEIIPGGPAAFSEIIEKGDQIVKVSPKKGEDYSVSCNSLEKIGEVIFSDTHKKITLSLRKKNGNQYDVTIEKKIMKADDNSAYSFVTSKDNLNVGYLNIPSFYTDFDNETNKGLADDVVREILKLKKDNIKGLIIDLQNNGGGSMEEAIKLSGMFIDAGPISVLVNNKKNQKIIRDFNRGSAYNGPIIILVNGNSASASEFFASVMQDYNRAIIVGSKTLGKATMQQILPISNDNQNFVKVTLEKFYRITGKSHQQIGVVPDIQIPTLYDSIISREKNYKTSLKNDEISVTSKFIPYQRSAFASLLPMSQRRISDNEFFNHVLKLNTEINKLYNVQKAPIILNLESVFADVHSIDAMFNDIKKTMETEVDFRIQNTTFDNEVLKDDSYKKSVNSFRMKELQTNSFVVEAINIIRDYYKKN